MLSEAQLTTVAHELRNTPDCKCTAHHFIPGWTWSGLTSASNPGTINPLMWTPRQTVDYYTNKIFVEKKFFAVCPDNECSAVGHLGHSPRTEAD